MKEYQIIETISNDQFIAVNKSDIGKPVEKIIVYFIRKHKLTEENRAECIKRMNAMQFLQEKKLIHLHDVFIREDSVFTVEQITGFQSFRSYLWQRSQMQNKQSQSFSPLSQTAIRRVVNSCIETLGALHALNIPYGHLSPLNILIERKTKRFVLRPLEIFPATSVWHATKLIDPFTLSWNEEKLIMMEFEERQVWYLPPEVVFRLKETSNYRSIYSDRWAIGCIFAECLLPFPIFSADDLPNQIVNTLTILGLPKKSQLPKLIIKTGLYATLEKKLPVLHGPVEKLRAFRKHLNASNMKVSYHTVQILLLLFSYEQKKRPNLAGLGQLKFMRTEETPIYKAYSSESSSSNSSPRSLSSRLSQQFLNEVAVLNDVEFASTTATDTDANYSEGVYIASVLNGYHSEETIDFGRSAPAIVNQSRDLSTQSQIPRSERKKKYRKSTTLKKTVARTPIRQKLQDMDSFLDKSLNTVLRASESSEAGSIKLPVKTEAKEPIITQKKSSSEEVHDSFSDSSMQQLNNVVKIIPDLEAWSYMEDIEEPEIDISFEAAFLKKKMNSPSQSIEITLSGVLRLGLGSDIGAIFSWDLCDIHQQVVDEVMTAVVKSYRFTPDRWNSPLLIKLTNQQGVVLAYCEVDISLLGLGRKDLVINGWYHMICASNGKPIGQVLIKVQEARDITSSQRSFPVSAKSMISIDTGAHGSDSSSLKDSPFFQFLIQEVNSEDEQSQIEGGTTLVQFNVQSA